MFATIKGNIKAEISEEASLRLLLVRAADSYRKLRRIPVGSEEDTPNFRINESGATGPGAGQDPAPDPDPGPGSGSELFVFKVKQINLCLSKNRSDDFCSLS